MPQARESDPKVDRLRSARTYFLAVLRSLTQVAIELHGPDNTTSTSYLNRTALQGELAKVLGTVETEQCSTGIKN